MNPTFEFLLIVPCVALLYCIVIASPPKQSHAVRYNPCVFCQEIASFLAMTLHIPTVQVSDTTGDAMKNFAWFITCILQNQCFSMLCH